ncbi:hypothetical protein [Chryseobacterium sp.]|uniref:hypothetical protein n=1 Tax=Chryseobacterium sp. TaxID=1871047 RepID=UPI00321C1C3A
MYASDADSDVDALAEILYFSEQEDEISARETSTFVSRTSNTDSDEFPIFGVKQDELSGEFEQPSDSELMRIDSDRKFTSLQDTTTAGINSKNDL